MKKTIYSLTLLSLLALSTPASAQEINARVKTRANSYAEVRMELKARMDARMASTTLRTEDRMASSSERREDKKTEMEARKASSTARRVEMQQGIAQRQMERATKVFTATIEHLENILARLESRIAKVKAEGGVTTESESFVVETKVHLTAAKTSLVAFSSIQITSDKASENFEAVRTAGGEVKAHLKEAHQSLVKALKALKGVRNNESATSTDNRQGDN